MVQLSLFGGAGAGSCAGGSSCPSFSSVGLSSCRVCPALASALACGAVRYWSGSAHSSGFRSLLAYVFSKMRGCPLVVGRVGRFSGVRCSLSGLTFQLCSGSRFGEFFVSSSESFQEGL